MKLLEAKIPPPAVAAAIALAMWGISLLLPRLQISGALRLGATAAIALIPASANNAQSHEAGGGGLLSGQLGQRRVKIITVLPG